MFTVHDFLLKHLIQMEKTKMVDSIEAHKALGLITLRKQPFSDHALCFLLKLCLHHPQHVSAPKRSESDLEGLHSIF